MSVRVITPPEAVVSLAEAKAQLNMGEDDPGTDDALISGYILAATANLDGPAGGWLGRAIGAQELEMTLDGFPAWAPVRLPFPPIIEMVSVKYDDTSGAEQTVDPARYRLTPAGLSLVAGAYWPTSAAVWGAVRVRYRAGYAPGKVPAQIKQAILLLMADLYANREARLNTAAGKVEDNPTVERLLNTLRVYG